MDEQLPPGVILNEVEYDNWEQDEAAMDLQRTIDAELDTRLPVLDAVKLAAGVKFAVDRLTRATRINAAAATPRRQRTAEQAALCALGRLIQEGTFR